MAGPILTRIAPEQSRIDWNNRPVRVHSPAASGPVSLKPTHDSARTRSGSGAIAWGERDMSPGLIAVIGTGVALAGLNVTATIWLASRVRGVGQRIARIEGLLEGLGLTARATPPALPPA